MKPMGNAIAFAFGAAHPHALALLDRLDAHRRLQKGRVSSVSSQANPRPRISTAKLAENHSAFTRNALHERTAKCRCLEKKGEGSASQTGSSLRNTSAFTTRPFVPVTLQP